MIQGDLLGEIHPEMMLEQEKWFTVAHFESLNKSLFVSELHHTAHNLKVAG